MPTLSSLVYMYNTPWHFRCQAITWNIIDFYHTLGKNSLSWNQKQIVPIMEIGMPSTIDSTALASYKIYQMFKSL